MKNWLVTFWRESLETYKTYPKWLKIVTLVLFIVDVISIVIGIGLLIGLATLWIISFLSIYKGTIITGLLVIVLLWAFLENRKQERIALEQRMLAQANNTPPAIIDYSQLDFAYVVMAEMVMNSVNSSSSVTGIAKVSDIEELFVSDRFEIIDNTIVNFKYHLTCSQPLDIANTKRLLETRFSQMLMAGKVRANIAPTYMYRGRSYAAITVNSIEQCQSIGQLKLVVTDDEYLRRREQAQATERKFSNNFPTDNDL